MNNKKKENKKIPQYVVVNEEESQYRMGLMTFKPNLSIDKLDKILTQNQKNLLSRPPIYQYEQADIRNIRVLFPHAEKWQYGVLTLSKYKLHPFLKEVEHIGFPQLVILNLDSNSIKSVQCICRINAPNLDCISMLDNNVIEVKEFRKTIFYNLTRIYFCVTDNTKLSQFHGKSLQLFQNSPSQAYGAPKPHHSKIWNSIGWIAKMQSTKLRRVLTSVMEYGLGMNKRMNVSLKRRKKNELVITA